MAAEGRAGFPDLSLVRKGNAYEYI